MKPQNRGNNLPHPLAWLIPILLLAAIWLKPSLAYAGRPTFSNSNQTFGEGDSQAVALADLDADGDLDIFVANGSGQANEVWLNNGQGAFSKSAQMLGNASSTSVSLGDVDGDGDIDALVGNTFGQANRVWLNDGHALFTDNGQTLGAADTRSVALGDIDGDGDLDALTGNDNGQPNRVWLNNGVGLFSDSGQQLGNSSSTGLRLGYLDNDTDLDLFVANGSGQSDQVWLNNGAGLFTNSGQNLGAENSTSVALGDLDRDGDLDAFVTILNDPVQIWLNDGNGSFSDSDPTDADLISRADNDGRAVALADLNSDGLLDAFTANFTEANIIWEGLTAAKFDATGEALGVSASMGVALGDLDGDGDLDAAVANLGFNRIWLNNGHDIFQADVQTLGNANSRAVAVGDVDGDGDLDAFVGNQSFTGDPNPTPNLVWLNDGQGTFSNSGQALGDSDTWAVALGDLDGDHDLDVFVANEQNQPNQVYLNNGAGIFSDSGQAIGSSDSRAIALGDLDGDGDLDAFVANNTNQPNRVWLNTGAGTFLNTDQALGNADSRAIALGDLDGDGDLDAVVGNFSGQPNRVWLNDGKATFQDSGQLLGSADTYGLALGDLDGDGDLDAFSANGWNEANQIWLNNGNAQFMAHGQNLDSADSYAVALGDLDGDGDLDAFVGNHNSNGNLIWLNDGQANFHDSGQTLFYASRFAVALADMNGDGNLDVFTTRDNPNLVYLSQLGGQSRFQISITRPGPTASANFYSTPVILTERIIPIEYTLFHPNNEPIGWVEAFYSLDGGDNWQPAIATSDTITTNLVSGNTPHTYRWDTFASGLFGQSDNVVIRLMAYPGRKESVATETYLYHNATPGPYLWPSASATTPPFRVRGTQVQVYQESITAGNELAGALVYRLPKNQVDRAVPMADGNATPFRTTPQGYLQGRGKLAVDDGLIALQPISTNGLITFTNNISLYHTSATPNTLGLNLHTITAAGVQKLAVSPQNKLLLLNLDITLEWDARPDQAYLSQLEQNLLRTSEILFDLTNGQAALGQLQIYQNKENWGNADIIIYASNNVRPNANVGGIVSTTLHDIHKSGQTIPNAYRAGQIRMGATWNRFGQNTGEIGEDWARVLAHEIGHYAFFLLDNYLGISDNGGLVKTDCQQSIMTNSYQDAYSEFAAPANWTGDCTKTVAAYTTGRSDWATIQTFYPLAVDDDNAGPATLPLAVTTVHFNPMSDEASGLSAPFFSIVDENGSPLFLSAQQTKAYLFKTQNTPTPTDDYIVPLGTPNRDFIQARGAEPGDKLCVMSTAALPHLTGCVNPIGQTEAPIFIRQAVDFAPQVIIKPITLTASTVTGTLQPTDTVVTAPAIFTTLSVEVTNPTPLNSLQAQLYPTYARAEPVVSLERSSDGLTFSTVMTVPFPVFSGRIHIWEPTHQDTHQAVTNFYLGTGWSGDRIAWDGDRIAWDGDRIAWDGDRIAWDGDRIAWDGDRIAWHGDRIAWDGDRIAWNAPVSSPDGKVVILNIDSILGEGGGAYSLQEIAAPPGLGGWLTPVGSAYRFQANQFPENVAITFNYLQRDVPEGQEQGLAVYFLDEINGQNWQRLDTELDTYLNIASAKAAGVGVYALISTVEIPAFRAGWNNFGYPIMGTRAVDEALASISGKYTALYHFDSDQVWRLYDPQVDTIAPEFGDFVNSVTTLAFGKAYWIHTTEAVTLSLGVAATPNLKDNPRVDARPPATYYGWVQPDHTFIPNETMAVKAIINGKICGLGQVVQLAGKWAYKVQVQADSATLNTGNCGQPGRLITLYLNETMMHPGFSWDNTQPRLQTISTQQLFIPTYLPIVVKP